MRLHLSPLEVIYGSVMAIAIIIPIACMAILISH